MYSFEYVRPASLSDASKLLLEDEGALLLAGGMSLLPMMKHRLVSASSLIDLGRLEGLAGISMNGRMLRIGAMTRHAEVAASDMVRSVIPSIADLASNIGDRQVRYRGTIGGSVANNDPAADYPAALLALGARIQTTQRSIGADEFFTGMFSTVLDRGEILVSVEFPAPSQAAYMKFKHPASRFALVGVFVARDHAGNVRVAVSGAAPCAFRLPALEEALTVSFAPEAANIAVDRDGLNSDMHGDAQYRAHLIKILSARAVLKAKSR